MLSYRHGYHAGNHADVIKHLCLVEILDYLTQKDKPLCYIDTHSGGGAYSLQSHEANKTAEYKEGIGKLWQARDLPEPLARYTQLVAQLNSGETLKFYPGSPWFAQTLLRANDRLFLSELHPNEVPRLQKNFGTDKRIHIRAEDGLALAVSLLPPKEKRALVLIDPSYEIKTEYKDVLETLTQAYKRFASGTYALWYPVVERQRIVQMEKAFKRSAIKNIVLVELGVAADNSGGMTASGMIIINPPWQLKDRMTAVLPYLCKLLAGDNGHYRMEQLVAE